MFNISLKPSLVFFARKDDSAKEAPRQNARNNNVERLRLKRRPRALNRKERGTMSAALLLDSERCGLCSKRYEPLEHTYQGRRGRSYVVACSDCGESALNVVLGGEVANIPSEYRPRSNGQRHPRHIIALASHPLIKYVAGHPDAPLIWSTKRDFGVSK